MADRQRRRVWPDVVGLAAGFAGLAIVMVRVPAGLSVGERIGLWALLCGVVSVLAYLRTKYWD